MTDFFTVRRRSNLDIYLQETFPHRNYISQARSRDAITNDVITALQQEIPVMYRDHEMAMCYNSRFEQLFKLRQVFFDNLPSIIESDLLPAYCPPDQDQLYDSLDFEMNHPTESESDYSSDGEDFYDTM